MQSCATMIGQYRQVGPHSQSSQAAAQLTNNTMRNRHTGTADNSYQYSTANAGVRPPQRANFTYHNGAYSYRQPTNWQTSAVPHQTICFQQPARDNNYVKMLTAKLQHSPTNMQSGNPSSLVTYGFQQDFHQNSAQISATQSPSNMMKANTTYSLQNMSALNQSVRVHRKQSIRTQDGNIVSNLQHCGEQDSLFHNINGQSTKPGSAYTTTACSPQHEKMGYPGTLVPAAAQNSQTVHNHNHRQSGTQHGFSLSISPPSNNRAVAQSFQNSITTNLPSSGHNLHVSSQKTQQYSTHNTGGEATSSITSNSYSRQCETSLFLSQKNELPLNPAVDTQEKMHSSQAIARIADYLRNSFPAGSDGGPPVYTSTPYGKQCVSEVRMAESNQNMQPVTGSYSSNTSQFFPINSGQFLPITTHSVMSTQHSVDVPPQQSSVPNVFYVTATGDGSGNGSKTANAFFPKEVVNASELKQLLVGISPQNGTQSSVENHERLEKHSSVKANDSSIHSSPGRTRAVAVVQPLSHESYQVVSKHTSSSPSESLSNPENDFISPQNKQGWEGGSSHYLENPKQIESNKSAIRHSAAPNDVSSSDSPGPQDSQKKLCEDDTGSELAVQVDQHVEPTSHQSVTSEVLVSQSGDKDKSEMPTDPNEVFELSSLPTTPWTHRTLTRLIKVVEKARMELKDDTVLDSTSTLLNMFWNGSCKNLASMLKTGWYKDLMYDVVNLFNEEVTPDFVILSHVHLSFRNHLKHYHVLKDNEMYSELPYKSSWLNVNEKLDDIDREFDFPQSLKHGPHTLESDSQPDQVEIINSDSAQIVREVSDKMLFSKELEPVDSSEEKQDSVKATSTHTSSSFETQSTESSNPYYSFEIKVLPPEEAKVIFEQIQSKLPQSMDKDNQPERDINSSVEDELPEVIDATLSDTKLRNEPDCPIEQVCCIPRLKEIIWGSNIASLGKCQCKYEQSHKNITDKNLDEEEMEVQKGDPAISSDGKFHSATEGESQATGGKNLMTLIWPELCNELSDTFDFTVGDDRPHSYSDKEQNNISHISLNSSQSSIALIDENEDDLSRRKNEIPNQMPDLENDCEHAQVELTESSETSSSDKKETQKFSRRDTEIQSDPEVNCVQDQSKSTATTQSCTLFSSDKEIENLSSSEVANQMSDLKENCGRAQLTSTNVSSLDTQNSVTGALQTTLSHETVERNRKRLSSDDGFFPIFKKSKKFISPIDVDSQTVLEGDSEHSGSNARTVELVLYGSSPPNKYTSVGGRKSHISSPRAVSDAVPRPPKLLTVHLSPLKRKSSETVPKGDYSVKQRLYEKWRRSLPPTTSRRRSKLKTQKYASTSLSGGSLKKAETVGPTNNEELPVSSDVKIWIGNTKTLKRRKSLSNGLKRGVEKTEKDTVTLNQLADQEISKAENGSHAAKPVQNDDVLKFRILPNTFNFKDGSNGRQETSDAFPDKPGLDQGTDKSPNKTVTSTKGTWLPNPEKKYCPLPKTSSLFYEFQKKYMEKTQPSMN